MIVISIRFPTRDKHRLWMVFAGIEPARLANGAASNDLQNITHSCAECGTTLISTAVSSQVITHSKARSRPGVFSFDIAWRASTNQSSR
jgi:hypothetical protein